jgi:hypothetical protein
VSQGYFPGRVSLLLEDLSFVWMSGNLLKPVENIGAKVSVSTSDTIILVELPKRAFTCSRSMISTKLESPDGGEKAKVVLVGSDEGLSGLASCSTTVEISIFCPIVPLFLVSSETYLSLWVELTPIFWYHFIDFMGGVFLPPKRLEGSLIGSFGLVLMYRPFGSLGLFMKEIKIKNYHLFWGNQL